MMFSVCPAWPQTAHSTHSHRCWLDHLAVIAMQMSAFKYALLALQGWHIKPTPMGGLDVPPHTRLTTDLSDVCLASSLVSKWMHTPEVKSGPASAPPPKVVVN